MDHVLVAVPNGWPSYRATRRVAAPEGVSNGTR
jgi:hypothetical protein